MGSAVWLGHNAPVTTPPAPSRLTREDVHALSNHLAVIVGFIELVLSVTSADDPRHGDHVEIRNAAHECARIVGGSSADQSNA